MALAPIARTSTVTIANPTPPTNVVAQYQGSPPTKPGLVPPVNTPQPDVTEANIFLFADPTNGAEATGTPVDEAGAPRPELSGLAEGDGTEAVSYNPTGTDATNNWSSQRRTNGNFSETPNASHPSFNSQAK